MKVISLLLALSATIIAQETEPNDTLEQANQFPGGIATWSGNSIATGDTDWYLIPESETLDGNASMTVSYLHNSNVVELSGHLIVEIYSIEGDQLTLEGNSVPTLLINTFVERSIPFVARKNQRYAFKVSSTGGQLYSFQISIPGTRLAISQQITPEDLRPTLQADQSESIGNILITAADFVDSQGTISGALAVQTQKDGGEIIQRTLFCQRRLGQPWKFTNLPNNTGDGSNNVLIRGSSNGTLYIMQDGATLQLWEKHPHTPWEMAASHPKVASNGTYFELPADLIVHREGFPIYCFSDHGPDRYRIFMDTIEWTIPTADIGGDFGQFKLATHPTSDETYAVGFANLATPPGLALAAWSLTPDLPPGLIDSAQVDDLGGSGSFIAPLASTVDTAGNLHIAFKTDSNKIRGARIQEGNLIPTGLIDENGSDSILRSLKDGVVRNFDLTSTQAINFFPEGSGWENPQATLVTSPIFNFGKPIFSTKSTGAQRGFAGLNDGNIFLYFHFDLSDPDNDGRSSLQEIAEGTDPNKKDSIAIPTYETVNSNGLIYPAFRFPHSQRLARQSDGLYSFGDIKLSVEAGSSLDHFKGEFKYRILSSGGSITPAIEETTVRALSPVDSFKKFFYRRRIWREE